MIRTLILATAVVVAGAASVAAQQSAIPAAPPGGAPPLVAPPAAPGSALPPPGQTATPATSPPAADAKSADAAKTKPRKPARKSAKATQKREKAGADTTLDLARRLDVLSPGTKLDQPMDDPANPSGGRQRADRVGIEGRDFAMPLDPKGEAGFVARGYHQEPTWYNPHGILGGTLSLRRRF